MVTESSQSKIRRNTADEFNKTQPILETILLELRENNTAINRRLDSIQNQLDQQDAKSSQLAGQINLAGNIAAEAKQQIEEVAKDVAYIKDIVSRLDQALLGVNELAKSGFDIATALRSVRDTEPPPNPFTEEDWPTIEIKDYKGRYSVAGTGV